MNLSVKQLIETLETDPWRQEVGYSDDVRDAQESIWSGNEELAETTLNKWLLEHQPCLFGRIAARLNLLSYCILTDSDLKESDKHIREKIQKARLSWSQEALLGEKSGFVILAACRQISDAIPDEQMLELSRRLCSLYLLKDIQAGEIYLDELRLKIPGKAERVWRWDVGANYFCTQGDKRWWHDHRIPGGLAFSMNSVGHMVSSSKLSSAMKDVQKALDLPEDWNRGSIESLPKALAFAMRTIDNAAETVSGRATQLLPLEQIENFPDPPSCPIELPQHLSNKNYCEYLGFYHTDQTIPFEYFRPDVERPNDVNPIRLDFTYLFDERLDNFDFINMGEGRQIQSSSTSSSTSEHGEEYKFLKRNRAAGEQE